MKVRVTSSAPTPPKRPTAQAVAAWFLECAKWADSLPSRAEVADAWNGSLPDLRASWVEDR